MQLYVADPRKNKDYGLEKKATGVRLPKQMIVFTDLKAYNISLQPTP